MLRRRIRLVILAAFVGALAATSITEAAPTLPPQLVARLQTERGRAQADLESARIQLGEAATSQRAGAATAARAESRASLLQDVAALVSADVPARFARDIGAVEQSARTELKVLDAKLDAVTEVAARAQAAALDSDRRLRALQRASATEDDRDTTLGSWRFGSGGPPVSADSLDRYLASKGSPLVGSGAEFLAAGVEHEVDPRLVVAIAGAESYFGIQTCAPHNAWGWGCPSGPYRFDSWAHAIETVTVGLRTGYLDDGLDSVGEIHLRYAPPDAANDPTDLNYGWADNVARFLAEQGGDPQDIAGVLGPSR